MQHITMGYIGDSKVAAQHRDILERVIPAAREELRAAPFKPAMFVGLMPDGRIQVLVDTPAKVAEYLNNMPKNTGLDFDALAGQVRSVGEGDASDVIPIAIYGHEKTSFVLGSASVLCSAN